MPAGCAKVPAVGIGLRSEAREATVQHLSELDVLEVTVDHYIFGSPHLRLAIQVLSRQIPLVAHGVGLSIGTALPPDRRYLDSVTQVVELIGSPWYSEHLAFTKVPGRDLAQLLPLPRTRAVAEIVAANVNAVRKHVGVPIALENITYYFEYPESEFSELEFIELSCRESGAYLLLDVENLYINSRNHGYDPFGFIDALPEGIVKGIHVAGGIAHGQLMIDSHDQPLPNAVLQLLHHALQRQMPETIILERDQRLEVFDEVLADVRQLRGVVSGQAVT
jgi:uncharacterized protein (UPF0276 family)